MNLFSYFIIFLGGGLGSCFRVFLGVLVSTSSYSFLGISGASLGVLLVNASGGFVAGMCITFFPRTDALWLFLVMGFLGGFTTFSSYSVQVLEAGRMGNWSLLLSLIVANNACAILGAYLGYRYSPL